MAYVGKITDSSGTTGLVGSTLYGTCTTAAGTAAKVVTLVEFDKLITGVTVHVKMTNSNTASNPTLNVNSTGAKSICRNGTTKVGNTEGTSWVAGAILSFTYDGTNWVMNDSCSFPLAHTHPDQDIKWGTANVTGSYNFLDGLMNQFLSPNRFAGAKAAGITIEYSNDAGSTWTTYPNLTDMQKSNIFTNRSQSVRIGGPTSVTPTVSANSQLRITVDTSAARIYTAINKIHIYISTNHSQNCKVTIKAATHGDPTNFSKTICDNHPISGWSGWNVVVGGFTTYGNTDAQYQYIQFTFTHTGTAEGKETSGLQVTSIMGFGGVGWITPSQLASSGHAYAFDGLMRTTFPNTMTISSGGLTVSSGGITVTGGVIKVLGDQCQDSYSGAVNMNNSNIYGLNSIYTADASDDATEGFHFYRDTTHVDTFRIASGKMYFYANRTLGQKPNPSGVVLHTGNTTVTQTLSSGTKIGTITIDGTDTDIYCQTNTDTKVTVSTISDDSTDTWYRPTFAASAGTDGLNIIDSYRIHHVPGTTTDIGTTQLSLGNNIASGDVGNKRGLLSLYSTGSGYTSLKYDDDVTDNTVQTFPSITGVVLNSGTTSFTQSLSSGTKIGTIKINNVSTDIYAPSASTPITYTLSGAYGGTNNSTWVSTLTPSSGTASTSTVPTASTSVYGITKLSSATNSTSTSLAATASAVKSAYDLADGKSTVSFTRSLSSGTKIGSITIDGTSTDIYCQTNSDTKVTSTELAASTAAANYMPTFVSTAGTSGVNIISSFGVRHTPGTTSAVGNTRLVLGNATASGTADNEEGYLLLYGPGSGYATLHYAEASVNSNNTLPSTGGTLLNTGTTSFTQSLSSGTKIGSIKIDGDSTDIYAPTNTDTKVTQTVSSDNKNFPLLLSYYESSSSTTTAQTTNRSNSIYANPSTGLISSAGIIPNTAGTFDSGANGSIGTSDYSFASSYVKTSNTETENTETINISNVAQLTRASGDTFFRALRSDTSTEVGFGVNSGGTNHGLFSFKLNQWLIYSNGTYNYIRSNVYRPTSTATGYAIPILGATPSTGAKVMYNSEGLRFTTLGGTTSVEGIAKLLLGNGVATGSANNMTGSIRMYGSSTSYGDLSCASDVSTESWILPAKSGTIAIVDEQPVIYSARITSTSGTVTVSNATYDWTKYSLLMMTIQSASSQMWNSFMIPWIWARANVDSGTYWRPSELESINDTAFITDCTDTGFTMGFQTGSWDAPFNISIIGII